MNLVRRQLFWKVYLTLLGSLFSVAVLLGVLWWSLGGTTQERWGAFRVHLNEQIIPERDEPPGAVGAAVARLGRQIGADVSLYGSDGTLLAAHGERVYGSEGAHPGTHHRVMRIDLPDGRSVMARLEPPVTSPGLRILILVGLVAGSVGLAALPVTARLTRRLETLRAAVQRWGNGQTQTRADEGGSDEVASVARTFNAAAERVDKLLTSQRALLANASHELRSPLARLRMAIELWTHEPVPDTRDEVVRNLGEIDQLVEEILLSSRLDHPSVFVSRTGSVDLLGLAAEEAARFDAACTGAAAEIEGNPTLLRRLLRNLLENAARHGRPPIQVAVENRSDRVEVIVSDHGDGIAPEERGRVFEPFYRPAGRGEASGGWGLGLSLCQQIAAHHGGAVTCDAAAGGGSRFTVSLPKRMEPPAAPSRSAGLPTPSRVAAASLRM